MAAQMVRVSSKGQIVLPKKLRDKFGIEEGDYLYVGELSNGVVVLSKTSSDLLDAILEPFRREVAAKGYTRDDINKWVKEARQELYEERMMRENQA